MILYYGSLAYCMTLGLCALLCWLLWFALKGTTERTKLAVLFGFALINIVQHLFKHVLYPHLRGAGFGLENTACNVCATLIFLTPFALAAQKGFFRVFVSYLGAIGSLGAMLFPVWFLGKPIWNWEFFRYAFCHFLLFLTSALPILWGMRRPDWRDFWKSAPAFFVLLSVVLLNDLIVICADTDFSPETLYGELCRLNPFGLMAPQGISPVLDRIFAALTPKRFLPTSSHPYYTPVLWCAFPLYAFVTLASFFVFALADRKGFALSCKRRFAFSKRKKLIAK